MAAFSRHVSMVTLAPPKSVTVSDFAIAAIAEATGGTPTRPIVIEVRGGVVVDVQNVPPGYRHEIRDYDDQEAAADS
jgi:hypothetical protein